MILAPKIQTIVPCEKRNGKIKKKKKKDDEVQIIYLGRHFCQHAE
jgi:hypothetical protein